MAPRWLEIAWEQEGAGVAEIGGPAANKSIVAYFHDIGRPDVTSDEIAWCAAFYFWCLQKAGIDLSPIVLLLLLQLLQRERLRVDQVGDGCRRAEC